MPGGRVRGSRVRSAKQFFEEKAWAESARIKEESDRIDRKEVIVTSAQWGEFYIIIPWELDFLTTKMVYNMLNKSR